MRLTWQGNDRQVYWVEVWQQFDVPPRWLRLSEDMEGKAEMEYEFDPEWGAAGFRVVTRMKAQ